VKRYVATRSIALVLRGIPGIYLHGLVGTSNDIDAVLKSKSKRDINRQVIHMDDLLDGLQDPNSRFRQIRDVYTRLLEIRVRHCAFHPNGEQQIFTTSHSVFTVLRVSPDRDQHILTMTNVTDEVAHVEIPLSEVGVAWKNWYDLVGKRGWRAEDKKLRVMLQPYDVVWLIPFAELEKMIES
jgi:sucrose phosphorylase